MPTRMFVAVSSHPCFLTFITMIPINCIIPYTFLFSLITTIIFGEIVHTERMTITMCQHAPLVLIIETFFKQYAL